MKRDREESFEGGRERNSMVSPDCIISSAHLSIVMACRYGKSGPGDLQTEEEESWVV